MVDGLLRRCSGDRGSEGFVVASAHVKGRSCSESEADPPVGLLTSVDRCEEIGDEVRTLGVRRNAVKSRCNEFVDSRDWVAPEL